jgi:hypothetical protein
MRLGGSSISEDGFHDCINRLEWHAFCAITTGVHGEGYSCTLYEYDLNRCRMAKDNIFRCTK